VHLIFRLFAIFGGGLTHYNKNNFACFFETVYTDDTHGFGHQ